METTLTCTVFSHFEPSSLRELGLRGAGFSATLPVGLLAVGIWILSWCAWSFRGFLRGATLTMPEFPRHINWCVAYLSEHPHFLYTLSGCKDVDWIHRVLCSQLRSIGKSAFCCNICLNGIILGPWWDLTGFSLTAGVLGCWVFLSDNGPNSHFDTRVRIGSGYSELFVDLRACFGTKLKRSQDSADSSSHPFFTFRLVKRWQISLGLCAPSLSNQNRSFVHKASLARLATQTSVCAQFAWECHPGEELNLVLKKMFKEKKAISASSRRQHKGGCRFLRLAWNCITAYCI